MLSYNSVRFARSRMPYDQMQCDTDVIRFSYPRICFFYCTSMTMQRKILCMNSLFNYSSHLLNASNAVHRRMRKQTDVIGLLNATKLYMKKKIILSRLHYVINSVDGAVIGRSCCIIDCCSAASNKYSLKCRAPRNTNASMQLLTFDFE